jgi:hypothetical protein
MNRVQTRGLAAAAMIAMGFTTFVQPAQAATPFGAYAELDTLNLPLTDGGQGSVAASRSYQNYFPSTNYGDATYAAASLRDGKLHASAMVTWPSCDPLAHVCDAASGGAHAAMWDTVTFKSVDGGPLEVIGLIPTSLEIDGHLSEVGATAMYRSYFGSNPDYSPADMPWEVLGDGTRESLDSLFVPLGTGPMYVYFELWVTATSGSGDATADFGNTMSFNWELPEGVIAESASGVFLKGGAAAVPEPATWAMMILGFGLVGMAVRRRPNTLCV